MREVMSVNPKRGILKRGFGGAEEDAESISWGKDPPLTHCSLIASGHVTIPVTGASGCLTFQNAPTEIEIVAITAVTSTNGSFLLISMWPR